jgi:Tol biopolymer transport system component
MTLVSVAGDGTPANDTSDNPAISADGRFIAFQSLASNLVPRDFNRMLDVFVRDLQSNTTERVSLTSLGGQASVPSRRPAISGDGRFVTFLAGDGNIVPGDKNGRADIFIRDRKQGVTQILSVSTAGQPAHDHSGVSSLNFDGSVVAFASIGQDIVEADTNIQQDVFVRVQPDAELSPSNSP